MEIEHLVAGVEAEFLVDWAALIGSVQGYDADAATLRFGHAFFCQHLCQALSPIFGLDEDVEDVAALSAGGVQKMRRPVEDQQTRGCDRALSIACYPSGVLVFGDHPPDPRLEVARHLCEYRLRCIAHVGEHRL